MKREKPVEKIINFEIPFRDAQILGRFLGRAHCEGLAEAASLVTLANIYNQAMLNGARVQSKQQKDKTD